MSLSTPEVAPEVTPEVAAKALTADGLRLLAAQTGQVTGQVASALAAFFSEPRSAREIQFVLELRQRENFLNRYLNRYLNPLIANGILERTLPDKPNSRLQKYRLTAAGRKLISSLPRP